MSPAMVAVNVRIGCRKLNHGLGIWAALPEAIHTTMVSPSARIIPRRQAARIPLLAAGMVSEEDGPDGLRVKSHELGRVGDVAFRTGVAVHELRTVSTDLESLYFRLTTSPENRNRNLEGSAPVQDAEPAVRQEVAS